MMAESMILNEQGHRFNTDKTVVVATDYFWLPITSETPLGAKLQLLTLGGVAMYGNHTTKSDFCTHWAPLPKRLPEGVSIRFPRKDEQEYVVNADSKVVVATDYYWIPVSAETPVGAKLQLLGLGGVAIYSPYSPKEKFFTHWAPLPKKRPS
jgi:hypothetical protein